MAETNKNTPEDSNIRKRLVKCLHVNRKLVLLKAHFVFFVGSLACVIPSLILYCQQLGASVSMVGLLFAVLPFVQCIVKPITGGIADKYQMPKMVFLISIVTLAVSCFSIHFIPEVEDKILSTSSSIQTPGRLSCDQPSNSLNLELCNANSTGNKSISTSLNNLTNCHLVCDVPETIQLNSLRCRNQTENCSTYTKYDPIKAPTSDMEKVNLTVAFHKLENVAPENNTVTVDFHSNCKTLGILNLSFVDSSEIIWTSTNSLDCPNKNNFNFSCVVQCSAIDEDKHEQGSTIYQFVWLWIACIVMWSSFGTILSTSDAILLNTLGENRADYGITRTFSSIGWGLFSVISGQLIDWASGDSPKKDYSPGFYLFIALIICDFFLSIPMKVEITESPKQLTKDIVQLFKNVEFFLFILAVFFVGITTGFMWTFLVLYAFKLNGSQFIIGLNYAVECFLSEIPFFLASGWIVRKLGHTYSLCFVLLLTGFKCLCYAFIDDAWYILIIALMHGANYGVFYATAATYASIVAPPGASTTIQGLFQGIFEGAGVGFGSLLGGIVYDKFGGRETFRIFGISTIGIGCLYWLVTFLRNKRLKKSQPVSNGKS